MNDTNTNIAAAGFVGIVLVEATAIVLAVHRASRRAGDPEQESRRLAGITATGIAGWLAVVLALASSGVLSDFTTVPPRLMILLFVSMALFTVVTNTATARRLLAATPAHWPIALHSIRVPIELALYGLFVSGKLPVQMTFEGRNFDMLVGLTAPLAALAVARGWIGRGGALLWNILAFGLLLNIMGIALTTFPGPLHLDWPGVSNEIVATAPFAWLPAFLVPVAFFGHILSFRQLLSGRTASRPPERVTCEAEASH